MIKTGQFYSYETLYNEAYCLGREFSHIVDFRNIGISYDGRAIPVLQVGSGRKILFCSAGVHGRESVNPVVLLKIAESYCMAYQADEMIKGYTVRELLHDYAICFLPLLNPDGYAIATEGFSALKNPVLRQEARMKGVPYEAWKYNGRGTDINRNFPCQSYQPVKAGDYAGSEIETKLLMKMFRTYPSIAYLDFHSRGKIIYFYRNAMSKQYNQRQEYIASGLQKVCGYELGTKAEEMLTTTSGGNTVQYYSEKYGRPAITIETVAEAAKFPLDPGYQEETYEEICALPLEILRLDACCSL